MSEIKIIRASAGSGKTHSLTGAFLELLMNEATGYFKSILAVTFTNKATEEMKARIIEQLQKLANNEDSAYLNNLMDYTGFKENHIRNKSTAILQQILHGYSWFSIETIDTFFQKVLKSFARELGIPGNYSIEIETEPALKYAIDNMLDEIKENSAILDWLVQLTETRIDEGRVWDIKNELFNLSKEIFKESFATVSDEIYKTINDKDKLQTFKAHLLEIISDTENKISVLGGAAIKTINEHGFESTDFYQGNKGVYNYFIKTSEKQIIGPNKNVMKMLEGPECWASTKTKRKDEVIHIASTKLLPALNEIIAFIESHSSRYFTAKEIIKNLYSLGILSDIAHKIQLYCKDNNSFLLSDSPAFINKIIDNNEAPFIYEKIGNRYNHFMIDEFQDTSLLQWGNFKPLIKNSLSMGKQCLIVGDIKQSIYRWRNSDWEILANQIFNDFHSSQVKIKILDTNWRSCKEIVHFNNSFYPVVSNILNNAFLDNAGITADEQNSEFQNIETLYSGSDQLIADKSNAEGRVLMRFFDKEVVTETPDYYEDSFLSDIKDLLDNGYAPGDIAILVRYKNEGKEIADLLIRKSSEGYFSQPIQVISNESLFLSASHEVHLLVAALQFLVDQTDDIICEKLLFMYNLVHDNIATSNSSTNNVYNASDFHSFSLNKLLPSDFINNIEQLITLPLYELTERLISIFELGRIKNNRSELPYIHGFLDLVYEYGQNNTADLSKFIEFWDEEGCKKSVPASDMHNAVQIITIHKSKGLEFNAVIIPFCNWELNQKASTILWAKTASSDFNMLPCYPVHYSKGLLQTEFADYYIEEMLKSYVDNLNLLYVATTRSVEALIAYPVFKEDKEKQLSVSSIGDVIYQAMSKHSFKEFSDSYNAETKTFLYGKLTPKKNTKSDKKDYTVINSSISSRAIDRLYCKYYSAEYFTTLLSENSSPAKHGSVLHDILSTVYSRTGLKNSFDKAVFDGLINKNEAEDLLRYINSCMENELIESWFDDNTEIINEADILLPDGQTRRPDRVVIYPDHVDIIDYKFGSQKNEDEYKLQMKEYKSLCNQMRYNNVKAYLWYITLNQIVEV